MLKIDPEKYTIANCLYCNGKIKDQSNHNKGIIILKCKECTNHLLMIYCKECKTLFEPRKTILNEIICPNCSIVLYEYPKDYRTFNLQNIQYQLI